MYVLVAISVAGRWIDRWQCWLAKQWLHWWLLVASVGTTHNCGIDDNDNDICGGGG